MKKSLKQQRQEAANKQKQQQYLIWGFGALSLVFLLAAIGLSLKSKAIPTVDANDPAQVALGQQVYETQCSSCHGANLEGEANWQEAGAGGLLKAPPHDETGHTWHHSDAYLFDSIKAGGARLPADQGISPMPVYEDILTDVEITAVLSYIKSTWSQDIRAAQAQR